MKTKAAVKMAKYRKRHPWAKTYTHIYQRCKYPKHPSYKNYGAKGIKLRISHVELKALWYRDRAYLMKRPSIDRLDSKGHYTFDNCRYLELSENSRLGALNGTFSVLGKYKTKEEKADFLDLPKQECLYCKRSFKPYDHRPMKFCSTSCRTGSWRKQKRRNT